MRRAAHPLARRPRHGARPRRWRGNYRRSRDLLDRRAGDGEVVRREPDYRAGSLFICLDHRAAGGERRMKCGVQRILSREARATALVLDDGGEITADHVISSIGAPQTEKLFGENPTTEPG